MDDPRPALRASDADRDRVAGELRRHATEGRLDIHELDERLGLAYAARTIGDLQALTADLPAASPEPLPATRPAAAPAARRTNPALGVYLSVNLVCFTIWLIVAVTAGEWYPWFLWVAGPWGAVLLGQTLQRRLR